MKIINKTFFSPVMKFGTSALNAAKPNATIDSIIRVNHAGELGADCIYAGQMAVLGNTKVGPVIQHMWEQEKIHRATFENLVVKYRVRPTALTPIWSIAGFVLGAGTALLGEKAAMACTVAVESVVVDHYNDQLRTLLEEPDQHKELLDIIRKVRDEEQSHHDSGIDQGAEQAPFYSLLSEIIKFGCRQAIAISKDLWRLKPYNISMSRNFCTSANSQPKEKWDLYSSICLERKPLILKPLTEFEKKIKDLLWEIENEKSHKSDHEIKAQEDLERASKIKAGIVLDDSNLDISLQQTAHEFEEASDKEFESFKPASRITEADNKNDVKSPNRKLSQHLVLLVNEEVGNKKKWILPYGMWKESETLRETAERILNEKFGNKLSVIFLGNAPCGFHKYKYPKNLNKNSVGAKIFFFKAIYTGGEMDMSKANNVDFQWATRDELRKLLDNKKYSRNVSMFLIEDDSDDSIVEEKVNEL